MPKYRVKFETEVQVDGWTDWRDREFEKIREQITVLAKNLKQARRLAIKNSCGYYHSSWGPPRLHRWYADHIKSITRLKSRT